MELRAPAKINLSFRISRRRDDGFHEIETLMAPISLHDVITIERSETQAIELTCSDPAIPLGEQNLIVRAARLFFDVTGYSVGLTIHLEKRIPHGAGLGGGSSDAATVLMALNQMLETKLPNETLAELGAQIGSDVPFFIFQSSARCSGRGEIVMPVSLPQTFWLLLLKPRFGVATPWAYSRWRESRALPGVCYYPQEVGGVTFNNDLEAAVFEKYVFLARMKMWLLAQQEVTVALMSGSGSTMFAVLREPTAAKDLAARAKAALDPKLWSCACSTE